LTTIIVNDKDTLVFESYSRFLDE